MWSQVKLVQPSEAQRQIQRIAREHIEWIDRLVQKYGLPRAVLLRMLDRPLALEDEIAQLFIDRAIERAVELFRANEPAPPGNGLADRAVRGIHAQLIAQKEAQEEAERMRQYRETDELLRKIKAGEDV